MSFWDFLNWLWSVATRVLDWFSDQFTYFFDRVANFWLHVWSVADTVLDIVWNWIEDKANSIYSSVSSWIDAVYNWISELANGIYSWATDRFDSLISYVSDWVSNLWRDVTDFINQVYSTVSDWIGTAISNVIDFISPLFTQVDNLWDTISPFIPVLPRIVLITEINILSRLLDLAENGYATLRLFLDDPAKFILSMLINKLLPFLADEIGLALGSEEAELPDRNNPAG
jgi:phage-related protein